MQTYKCTFGSDKQGIVSHLNQATINLKQGVFLARGIWAAGSKSRKSISVFQLRPQKDQPCLWQVQEMFKLPLSAQQLSEGQALSLEGRGRLS